MTSLHDVDGGWAWFVLAASYMNLLIAPGLAFVGGMFQNLFLEQFHQSVGLTAWVTSVFASLLQLAGPLASMVAHHSSCRLSVMLGGVLVSTGFVISSFTSTLPVLFGSFGILSGLGLGLIYTPSIVVVNFFFKKKRTFINGIILSASGTGIMVFPLLCRYLLDRFAWREVLLILSAVSVQMVIFGALMLPIHEQTSTNRLLVRTVLCRCCHIRKKKMLNLDASKPMLTDQCETSLDCANKGEAKTQQGSIYDDTKTKLSLVSQVRKNNENSDVYKPVLTNNCEDGIECVHCPKEIKTPSQQSSSCNEISKHSQLIIFKNTSFLSLCFMLFLWNAGTGVLLIHFPAFCKQHGTSDDEISYVMSSNGPALLVARILIGILGNDPNVDKLATFIGLHFTSGCLFFLIPQFARTFSTQITTMILMGIFHGGSYSLLTTLTIHIVGIRFLTSAFGVEMIFAGFGYLVAPPFAGWIVDLTGSYSKSIFLAGFLVFMSGFTLMSIPFLRGRGELPVGFRPVEEYELGRGKTQSENGSTEKIRSFDATSSS